MIQSLYGSAKRNMVGLIGPAFVFTGVLVAAGLRLVLPGLAAEEAHVIPAPAATEQPGSNATTTRP